jgi:dTDP-4-dehydrorhamnose 3,5-epimerase-like enzyme
MERPFIIQHPTFQDERGNFCSIQTNMIKDVRLDKNWVQVNTSISHEPYTIRGMHFQINGFEQTKYLKVVWGKIINFIICVDNKLPDFGEKYFFEVDKNQAVLVPKGYANALITLEPNTIIQYLVDNTYSPENERSLYYGSVPEFKSMVNGFTNAPVISEKDLNGILWEDWSNQ